MVCSSLYPLANNFIDMFFNRTGMSSHMREREIVSTIETSTRGRKEGTRTIYVLSHLRFSITTKLLIIDELHSLLFLLIFQIYIPFRSSNKRKRKQSCHQLSMLYSVITRIKTRKNIKRKSKQQRPIHHQAPKSSLIQQLVMMFTFIPLFHRNPMQV